MAASLYDIAEKLMEKKEARTRLGWVDWSTSSPDRFDAMRRACRIVLRARGIHTDRKTGLITRKQTNQQGETA